MLHRTPTSVTVTIDDSGQRSVDKVKLPSRFTLAVRTIAQAGERNVSNNHAAWRIPVRS